MIDRQAIGAALREAREAQDMSRVDVVMQIRGAGQKMSEATVTRAERGDDGVTFENLHAIADAVGVDLPAVPSPSSAAMAAAEAPAWFTAAMEAQAATAAATLEMLANLQEEVEALRDALDLTTKAKAPR